MSAIKAAAQDSSETQIHLSNACMYIPVWCLFVDINKIKTPGAQYETLLITNELDQVADYVPNVITASLTQKMGIRIDVVSIGGHQSLALHFAEITGGHYTNASSLDQCIQFLHVNQNAATSYSS